MKWTDPATIKRNGDVDLKDYSSWNFSNRPRARRLLDRAVERGKSNKNCYIIMLNAMLLTFQ